MLCGRYVRVPATDGACAGRIDGYSAWGPWPEAHWLVRLVEGEQLGEKPRRFGLEGLLQ